MMLGWIVVFEATVKHMVLQTLSGADPGGGLGGQDPPFWGTPKLHKVGKKMLRACTKATHFSS